MAIRMGIEIKVDIRNRSLISGKLFAICIGLILCLFAGGAEAQKLEHYNSPLYAPKNYDPGQKASNGLPPVFKEVGIEQKLNDPLPLDTEFKDEQGRIVKIGDYFGKRPVILALVYYECPMLCNEVLNGLTGSIKGLNFSAGKEFDVVAISFDARENDKSGLAMKKKEGYLKRYERAGSEDGFHFLTGRQDSIDKITKALGFSYVWDEQSGQFAHNGAIMLITPEGRISRYLYGVEYAPKDLKFGLMDASEGKIGNAAEQLLLYCFHYDPASGTYGFAVLRAIRIGAIATLIGIGLMFFVFWRRGQKQVLNEANLGI